jgi:hypothetical protein
VRPPLAIHASTPTLSAQVKKPSLPKQTCSFLQKLVAASFSNLYG